MKNTYVCRHFNGVQHKVCLAGIAYDSFTRTLALPCIDWHKKNPSAEKGYRIECATCPKWEPPTSEEIAAAEAAWKASQDRMMLVLKATKPVRKEQKGKNWRGTIECPICKGKLHLSHAAYNNHMHGRCETDGCVAWME
jgi:hypothetical protein